ncbi:NmrA-like family protein [Cercophora scortea]|uniref:NmrA-like family protein n=1 Tax=Cercophora scortea TaxID=314031 RepID=A0AAE0I880_9PEZI|nr:NmrA-like family protein [Cercophora scortea]
MSRALLICGATGKQGGAVIANLLKEKTNFEFLAVTRNANSPSAQALLAKSPEKIKLVQGDLDNPTALFQAAQALTPNVPIHGVFSVQAAIGSNAELSQGKALIDAAVAAKVTHFVYSSVDRHGADSPNTPTDIPHFRNKHLIEQHLIAKTAGTATTWTILRPVAFMENLTDNFFGRVFATSWKMAVKDKPLQLVAVSDIGFFGAQAFLKPEEYAGRGVSLAGDELTIEQAVKVMKEKTGCEMGWANRLFCSVLMWSMKDFGLMFKWFYDVGYGADIQALRKVNPGMKDFGTWLETESDFRKGKGGK